jgi:hypothetical protein
MKTLGKACVYVLVLLVGLVQAVFSQRVALQYEKTLPQAEYAASRLQEALRRQGYSVVDKGEYTIHLNSDSVALGKESYVLWRNGKDVTIAGGDARGMIYGSLTLAEDLMNGLAVEAVRAKSEKPHYPLRAIKYDLPWDTYRHSYALDLHYETCRDLKYWERFLDMMVTNRFNALSLWNLHPYTFMIRPKNFPEACPFNDQQLKEWQDLFHGIFKLAEERAIETYLIPFNIFVSPEFAKAHNVAMDNLGHHFFVKGDTSEIVRRYTRECVTQVLEEYPQLTGMGLTYGEGMGGMTPKQREDWMHETIIEGMRLANRKLKLVHRIPLSANTGSGPSTSVETEQMTRQVIEDEAKLDFIEAPIWADLKYNWSHAHSTTKLVKVHGGKLHDTYFNPVPTNYKVTWTARNEDFFCLRWGVPGFVRAHIKTNSQPYCGGYFVGSETYIPAVDYFTQTTKPVSWRYAFERQWLFYKIWGRLLYNPSTPDALFQAEFNLRYGESGNDLLEAYSLAGTVPLYLGSSFDFGWDFTLYSEGFLALNKASGNVEYISVNRQIDQPVTDPDYVSVKDYVSALAAGETFDTTTRVTPLVLADMLEKNCTEALAIAELIDFTDNESLMYEVTDVKIWSNLGLSFAEKLRGAVALQTYRTEGGEENKETAVRHLKEALRYWDEVVTLSRPIYKDMPLVHYSEQKGTTPAQNDKLRFHWEKVRPEVANDVVIAQQAVAPAGK